MATLNKLSLSTVAAAAEVTGAGGTGNDQQIMTLLGGARNRHKRSPWSSNYTFCKLDACDETDAERFPRVIIGRAEAGLWVKNVFLHVKRFLSTSDDAENVITVQMFKTTSLVPSATESAATLPPSLSVDIIPQVTVRAIRDTDDGYTSASTGHVPLPIEMDYIAAGEYWYLLFTPPSTSSMGWEDADVLIHFAELHRS